MSLISSLEKRFGSWAIPNLSAYLVALQVIGMVLLLGNYAGTDQMFLMGNAVIDRGQWWRLITFMMLPKVGGIWFVLAAYIFYIMGSALEQQWGTFRFNVFIGCGYLLTVAMAFISPGAVISNYYFLGCVFLAFATLFPNFELHLFFVLPVKMKWLGWLTLAMYVFTLFQSTRGLGGVVILGNKLGVIAAFITYALFFGRQFISNLSAAKRRKAFQARSSELEGQPRHTCAVCGATDQSDPALDFRYCSTCGECFCENHIEDHAH